MLRHWLSNYLIRPAHRTAPKDLRRSVLANIVNYAFFLRRFVQNGKGDSPRKKGVSEHVWARNWERIFGKKKCRDSRRFRKNCIYNSKGEA